MTERVAPGHTVATGRPSASPPRDLGLDPGMRVGVFGGSFDPFHAGHLRIGRAALEQAPLDRVLYLPTARPPHKANVRQATALERWTMAEMALLDEPRCLVGDHEMAETTSYTIDTLERLRVLHPDVEFLLILGEDSFRELDSWKDAKRIVEGWALAVYPRRHPGAGSEGADGSPAVWRALGASEPLRLEGALHDASSSRIRELLGAGSPAPDGWLPLPVLSFIQKYGLYQEPAEAANPAAVTAKAVNPSSPEEATEGQSSKEAGPISSAANEPSTDTAPDSPSDPLPEEVALAARAALDRKAENLVLLEVGEICGFADYFLLCNGNSDRQVGAIADGIQRSLREQGFKPLHVEGVRRANWILLDYGDWVAHIFDPPTRDFYRLERLWSDAERVSLDRIEAS